MWIRRSALLMDLAVERAKRESAEATVKLVATHAEFLRVRVNQLEVERTYLLQSLTKLPIPVPQLRPTPSQPLSDIFADLEEPSGASSV
jgi:hypothetical protein